ncbi:MAG: UDP-N-acetyl-D-galactosamine dehydrogenase [Bacteroidetes bacterium 41-46]|nr:MAG: UDP-N-acetyl-D-galactosamine dehydrogenase [Bacteroidetes bacterium 41-46]
MELLDELLEGRMKLAVVGLGYVGLPLALEFARFVDVVGVDVDEALVAKLWQGVDPNGEIGGESFVDRRISFTTNPAELKGARFIVVAVPTPVDKHNKPDLSPLMGATRSVGKYLKRGDVVVYESTVYPGCTEEECVPLLESLSGLKCGVDFKVGYSPERINPGDTEHSLQNTVKIVSGCDDVALGVIAPVYELVVKAGVHRAPGMKVAEAAKIIENTQRDVNIALMNELSILFNRMGINTYDVLKAAGTKWNFLPFTPGLVGGHCIGVDPYYLVHKAAALKYHTQMVASGRFVNDSMGGYIAKQTVKRLLGASDVSGAAGVAPGGASPDGGAAVAAAPAAHRAGLRVLVMGFTYKENVSDIRNTRVADIVHELVSYNISVDVVDPKADASEVMEEYGITITDSASGRYDAVILAVAHKEYREMGAEGISALLEDGGLFVDVRGLFRELEGKFRYWSL